MRDDVLMELVRRAQEDAGFRQTALADPERALAEHGFQPTPEELAAIREFHATATGLTEEELGGRLAAAGGGEGF